MSDHSGSNHRVAVAAPHGVAVDAARTVREAGGNAVDAAVAAAAALTVVYPHTVRRSASIPQAPADPPLRLSFCVDEIDADHRSAEGVRARRGVRMAALLEAGGLPTRGNGARIGDWTGPRV
nr:gamma-glutamyltransferase [Rhodococcus sp. JVH1]